MKRLVHLKRLWLLLLAPLGVALTIAASCSSGFAEWYAVTIYPWLSRIVNFFSSLLPISLAEIALFCLIPLILLYLFFSIRRIVRQKGDRWYFLGKAILSPLCAVCVLYASFVLLCGINYHRYPFSQVCGLTVQDSTVEELQGLCTELAQQASSLREQVAEDENGVMVSSFPDAFQVARESQSCYDKLADRYPTLPAGYGQPKPVMASRLMSYGNITGIYIPFTCEANVNIDVPDYSIPATMGHELSHLRGYMREDEANFLGYLCCRESSHPDLRYSAAMLAFTHATNQLFRQDPEAAQEIFDGMDEGVRRDRAYNSAYWERFEGRLSEVSRTVNNTYLQANSQEDGVQSYGRMVDLLLADQRQKRSK